MRFNNEGETIFNCLVIILIAITFSLVAYGIHMENMHAKGCHEELVRINYDNNSFHEELVWRCEKKNEN